MSTSFSSQRGQVGVIVLLIMVGMLTIGLSLAARTTQEAFLSGKETKTTRVFNAAEQGVETALSGDLAAGDYSLSEGEIEVDYSVEEINRLQTRLFEGIPVGIDVTGASDGDELRLEWSQLDDCGSENPASIVASIFNNDGGSIVVRHLALGACDRSDGFESATIINENNYHRRYDLSLRSGDFLVRVKPVYNDTHVNIYSNDAGFTLPVQSYLVRSSATGTETDETRIVEVNMSRLTAPSIFDYAVYSGNTLAK